MPNRCGVYLREAYIERILSSFFYLISQKEKKLRYLLALGRNLVIIIPETITPIMAAMLKATGPSNPDVEALFLKTNSMYFGRRSQCADLDGSQRGE